MAIRGLTLWILLVAIFGFFLPCQAEMQVDMVSGLWEITAEVGMQGVPIQMPPIVTRQCITPENIISQINQFNQSDQNCKVTNLLVAKNKASYDLNCVLETGEMAGHGFVSYRGERLKGSLTTTMTPGNMVMRYNYTGRRIGSCK